MSNADPGTAALDARLHVRRGGFVLDLPLSVAAGEVHALLGPNGAGKSTALQALAGLLALAEGHVAVGDGRWDDPGRRVFVPPQRRAVGVVFQDYLLFPHLSAEENVAFGLRARGTGRRAARRTARAWLDRVGLAELAGARPGRLSGGQAQRVALARALAPDPEVLLLDEPLAALDASTRLEIRAHLGRHLAGYGGRTVLVTHDPIDAMALADRLTVVEGGRVVQSGLPAEVARAPRTEYVARLVGLNLYRGVARGHAIALDDGGVLTAAETATGGVFVAVAPAAVALYRQRPEGSPRNVWRGRVTGLEQRAETVRVRLDGPPAVLADVTPAAVADLRLHVGQETWAAVKATEVRTYPA